MLRRSSGAGEKSPAGSNKRKSLNGSNGDCVSQVEIFHRILNYIGTVMREEPTVIHVSARPDRQSQIGSLRDLCLTHRPSRNIVLTTDLGKVFVIVWPYENLEVAIHGTSVVIDRIDVNSSNADQNENIPTQRGHFLVDYCRTARYLHP